MKPFGQTEPVALPLVVEALVVPPVANRDASVDDAIRATTVVQAVLSVDVLQVSFGGHPRLVLIATHAVWIRAQRSSILNTVIPAGSVLPFAVWYGRRTNKMSKKTITPVKLGLLSWCWK